MPFDPTKKYSLYRIRNPYTPFVYYGITCKPLHIRLRYHIYACNKNKFKMAYWLRCNKDDAIIEMICANLTLDEALVGEFIITKLGMELFPESLLNSKIGDDKYSVLTPETRAKISFKGKNCSPEVRAKRVANITHARTFFTPESVERSAAKHRGRKASKQECEMRSTLARGRPMSPNLIAASQAMSKPVLSICPSGKISYYVSIGEAARIIGDGVLPSHICKAIKRNQFRAGLKWDYVK